MFAFKVILSVLLIAAIKEIDGSLLPSLPPVHVAHPINAPPHVWETHYHNTLVPNPLLPPVHAHLPPVHAHLPPVHAHFPPVHSHVTPVAPILPAPPVAPLPIVPTAPLAPLPLPTFPEFFPWVPSVVKPPTLALVPPYKETHHHTIAIGFATPVLKPHLHLTPLFKGDSAWPATPVIKHVHHPGHFVKTFAPSAAITGWPAFPEVIG